MRCGRNFAVTFISNDDLGEGGWATSRRVVGGCSQQIIHDRLCAKSRLRRIETAVEREFVGARINRESPNRCVRRNRGETMDTRAGLQVNFDADEVRTLIADYLGISAKQVTDEAHFGDDLGLDWLDQLELMILIEDEFAGVEFSDAAVHEIEVVGDLIRHIEMSNQNAASTFRRSAA